MNPARPQKLFRLMLIVIYGALVVLVLLLIPRVRLFFELRGQQRGSKELARRVLEDPIIQHDPLLGWRHIPGKRLNIRLPDREEELVFQINGQGVRGDRDYAMPKPAGLQRILAVGDSFTFGTTSQADTWPQLLEQHLPGSETVNMGVNGYGVDQMYLLFKEAGLQFSPDVVICAVIEDDLRRAFLDRWQSGYGRPRFVLREGTLQLTNVPVPKRSERGAQYSPEPGEVTKPAPGREEQYLPFRILEEFQRLAREKNIEFRLVYLPTYSDLSFDRWFRAALASFTDKAAIPFLDITPAMRRRLGYEERTFIERFLNSAFSSNRPPIFLPDGHYNRSGNEIVAAELGVWLSRQPPYSR